MPIFDVVDHGEVKELAMVPTVFGRGMLPFSAYLVDGLLIDTGPPNMARQMGRFVQEVGIQQLVNTHHHEDHAGNNELIRSLTDVQAQAHALALPMLAALPRLPFYRRVAWGSGRDGIALPLGDVIETPRYRFEVLHTPGHAPDHVVLVERAMGWVFAGDLFIADKLKLLRREEDPFELVRSIERLLQGPVGTVWCAHRGKVADGEQAFRRKLSYVAELTERVRGLHRAGKPAQLIVQEVFGREGLVAFASRGDFCSLNLVEALLPSWTGPQPALPRTLPGRRSSR